MEIRGSDMRGAAGFGFKQNISANFCRL